MNGIEQIRYGVIPAREIEKMSVVEVKNDKYEGANSVYDRAMGPHSSAEKCVTCKNTYFKCPGHFGHIVLPSPVINPLFYRPVIKFLKVICKKCNRLIFTKKQLEMKGIGKCSKKINRILEELKNSDICFHCNASQPNITLRTKDNKIIFTEEGKSTPVSSIDVHSIFSKFPQSDVEILGFDSHFHPVNFILTVLPVMPFASRPTVIGDATTDDDITLKYISIVRCIRKLKDLTEKDKIAECLETIQYSISILFCNLKKKARHPTDGRPISGIFDRLPGKKNLFRNNLNGRRIDFSARSVITPDDTLKMDEIGIPRAYASKLTKPITVTAGNIRALSEIVNSDRATMVFRDSKKFNIGTYRHKSVRMQDGDLIVRRDETSEVVSLRGGLGGGMPTKSAPDEVRDKPIRFSRLHDELYRNGVRLPVVQSSNQYSNPSSNPSDDASALLFDMTRDYELKIGDIVERHLVDGDVVLLNRQPTLKRESMMAFKVRIMDGYTIRTPLCVMDCFGGDYDGNYVAINRRP